MLHPVLGTGLHLGLRADGRALRPCASSRNVPVAEAQNSINECMALPVGHFKIKEQIDNRRMRLNSAATFKCRSILPRSGWGRCCYGMGDLLFIGDVLQINASCHKDLVMSYCRLECEEFWIEWPSPSPGLSRIENVEDGHQICITGVQPTNLP